MLFQVVNIVAKTLSKWTSKKIEPTMLGFKNPVVKESAHTDNADDNLNFTTNLLEFKGSIRYRKTRSST